MDLSPVVSKLSEQIQQVGEGLGSQVLRGRPFIIREPLVKYQDKNIDVSFFLIFFLNKNFIYSLF